MWNWWLTTDFRGKLIFWGVFGLVLNGILFLFGYWLPKMLFVAIGMLLTAMCLRNEDSTDI